MEENRKITLSSENCGETYVKRKKKTWLFIVITLLIAVITSVGTVVTKNYLDNKKHEQEVTAQLAKQKAEEDAKDAEGFKSMIRSALSTDSTLSLHSIIITKENNQDKITIKIYSDGLSSIFSTCVLYNIIPNEYYTMLNTVAETSSVIREKGMYFGYNAINCEIVVLDDLNKNSSLITANNGVITQDILNVKK